jgi:F0F1-type ATP synthase assembly protein I
MKVNRENPWHALALVGVISIDIALFVILGVWLGNKLDAVFATAPFFLIAGVLLGIALGVLSVSIMVKNHLED